MNKILTVSVAAYNVQDYIHETLDCFVNVDGNERLEVIVVDDGGSDRTADIVNEYVAKYPDVFKLVQKKNGGWGSTINTSLKIASGKYFKLLDGDDFFEHDHLAAFLDGLEYMDSDLVITPAYAFESESGRRIFNLIDYNFKTNYRSYSFDDMNMYAFQPSVYGVCFKTEVLRNEKVEITEHCFYTDVEYVLKGCNGVHSAGSLPMEIYCYRKSRAGQSMSLEGVRKHYKDHLKMLLTMLKFEKEHVTRNSVHEMFENRLKDVCSNMYRWFLYLEPTDEHRKELIEFDQLIKDEYPAYYYMNTSGEVGILRKTNSKLYSMVAKHRLSVDQKNHYDLFA